jgi:hypothetical protein
MAKISGKDGKVIRSTNANITDANGTDTIVVDCIVSHGVGDRVLIEGVVGMTDLNGEHTITAVNAGVSISVVIPTTAQTYTSGGTIKLCTSITGWTLDTGAEVIKTTDSSSTTWDDFIASGFKGSTGSFEGFFETGTNDITVGSSASLILREDSSNYYTFSALITGNSSTLDVPGSEATLKTYTFQVTGTNTQTVA